jgi:hypothetical protein
MTPYNLGASRREIADAYLNCLGCLKIEQRRRVGKANGSRECAPDDRLRVPTIQDEAVDRWWARRKRAFAHPTTQGRDDNNGQNYASSTASAPLTASALSVTVFSSEAACTETFSAKYRASAT